VNGSHPFFKTTKWKELKDEVETDVEVWLFCIGNGFIEFSSLEL